MFYPSYYTGLFQELPFLCPKHGDEIQYITLDLLGKSPTGCRYCGKELTKGENHYLWKGGISQLTFYVRSYLYDWKAKSIEAFNYKCGVTGNTIDAVHHLYSFNLILKETLDNLNLKIHSKINQYTDDEKSKIVAECLKLHDNYGLGIPLCKEVHDLFHELYGKGNNTPEQFEEFKTRYNIGEFTHQQCAS